MNFISIAFAFFIAVLLLVLCFVKDYRRQNIVLLVASYLFYAYSDVRFLALLAGISCLMWFMGCYIAKHPKTSAAKRCLVIGVLIDVFVLGVFKYFNFFAEGFSNLFGIEYTTIYIILPLGISFYIFQAISYIVDVYTGKTEAVSSLVNVMLYIGFFPQITSGPIVKSHDFFPQLEMNRQITWKSISWGGQQFVVGLFKKLVIADRLNLAVNAVYDAPLAYSGCSLLATVLAYSLQIYYDFSGYSDMAIGVARMLGFELGKNFNLPYLAKNPSDFWRRWHISLSSWFRDYVYIPLGGSKKGVLRTYLNLFITMLLSGLWHGASWAFVIWGAVHALLSVVHKGFAGIKKRGKGAETKIGTVLSIIVNFCVVSILWIPFRTNDFGQAMLILQRIVTWSSGVNYIYVFTLIFAVMLLAVELVAVKWNQGNDIWKPLDLSKFWTKIVFCAFTLLIVCFAYIGDSAFIYAQF